MSGLSCPARGCRAPELAAGVVWEDLDTAWTDGFCKLSVECSAFLTDVQWTTLIQEFERGKAHCVYVLTLKLQVWDELPWQLAILAHVDEDVARAGVIGLVRGLAFIGVSLVQDRQRSSAVQNQTTVYP